MDPGIQILSGPDAERAIRAVKTIARHGVSNWALTGGLAVEIHRIRRGHEPSVRPLNDIDFIAGSFSCFPETLARDFLFRHVHPRDIPGKTMIQMVDPVGRLRIDVFQANESILSRTIDLDFGFAIVSLEDLVARTARLVLDLANSVPVASKHARDYLRLVALVQPEEVEIAWRDHRKAGHPQRFEDAARILGDLIPASGGLLVTPQYSTEVAQSCSRCVPTGAFDLADAKVILELLGYC